MNIGPSHLMHSFVACIHLSTCVCLCVYSPPCVCQGNTLGSVSNLLASTEFSGYPIVKSLDNMQLIGYVSRANLDTVLRSRTDDMNGVPLPPHMPTTDTSWYRTSVEKKPFPCTARAQEEDIPRTEAIPCREEAIPCTACAQGVLP